MRSSSDETALPIPFGRHRAIRLGSLRATFPKNHREGAPLKTQRGFIGGLTLGEGIVKLLIILAIVSALAGIAYAAKAAIENYNKTLLDAGKAEADAAWSGREVARVAEATKKEREWKAQFDAERAHHADTVATIVATNREQQKEKEAQYEKDLADVRAGALRLRDPGRASAAAGCRRSSPGDAPRPGAATAGANGGRTSELSPEATQFLLAEALRADRITEKLTALQKYTADLYAYCKGK